MSVLVDLAFLIDGLHIAGICETDDGVPFSHTKIHHVRFWVRDQGATDIDNLVPQCDGATTSSTKAGGR